MIKNKANFNTDGRKNAASRGGHRALAIPQSFLHTPSDASPEQQQQQQPEGAWLRLAMSMEKVGPWTKEEDEKLRRLVKDQTNVSAIKWR